MNDLSLENKEGGDVGDWEEQALPSPDLKQNENRAVTSFSLKNLWRRCDLPLGDTVISSDLKKI